jgi:hypothetical protein
MRRNQKTIAAPDRSDSAITLALVLGLFGILAAVGSNCWAAATTLFILAAVSGIGGLSSASPPVSRRSTTSSVKTPPSRICR